MAPCSRRTQLRVGPGAQLLVDAFRVIPTISLISCWVIGNGSAHRPRACARRFSVKRDQRTSQPAGQILQNNLFDLIAGPPQACAKQFDQLHRQRRLASHEGNKFATVDHKKFAIGIGDDVGGPGQPIEQRDFPENLAGADQIKNRTAAVGGRDTYLYGARYHRKQAVAGIASGKDRGSPLQRAVPGVATKLVQRLGLEIGKERMPAQNRQFAARKSPRFILFVLSHGGVSIPKFACRKQSRRMRLCR